jgi:MFS family permease
MAGLLSMVSSLLLTQLTATTPLLLLFVAYIIYGAGFGIVNPPITQTAVSGMPKSQAGVAAAIASTSRQVGAALGIAIAGSILASRRGPGVTFPEATHPIWWIMAGCGATVALLGWISATAWARASAQRVAHLLTDSAEPSAAGGR